VQMGKCKDDCCFKDRAQKSEEYFEDEGNRCKKEKGGHCWWSCLFVFDYVVAAVLLLFALIFKLTIEPYHMYSPSVNITAAVLDSQGVPHNKEIPIDIDQTRQFPVVDEALPTVVAGIVFAAVCISVFLIAQFVFRLIAVRKWNIVHDFHNFALGILESIALELFFCNTLKPFAGRYRPRYLELAQEAGSNARAEWEGRVSYPSGHSGTAFCTMFFCTLYLFGKTRAFSSSGRFGGGSAGRFGFVVFSLMPTLGAFLIAITRTRDYMHNFSDINAGCIIGILCSTVAYFTVYPSLRDPYCQLPRLRLPPKSHSQPEHKSESRSEPEPERTPSPKSVPSEEKDDVDLEEVVVNTDKDVDDAVGKKED